MEVTPKTGAALPALDSIPDRMLAAVYYGQNDMRLETVSVPRIGPGELLVRIHSCGICGTDLKKISTGSHSAPRVFGHEMAGVVVARGAGVTRFAEGDRVMVFHHIPCGNCYYCERKVFSQCPVYKRVGTTAGFGEPSGGGFCRVHPGDGLDCRKGRNCDSGFGKFRSGFPYRTGEYGVEGN